MCDIVMERKKINNDDGEIARRMDGIFSWDFMARSVEVFFCFSGMGEKEN